MLTLLLVEDNPGDAELIRIRLGAVRGLPVEQIWCESLEDGLDAFRGKNPDIVLLDLNLPDSSGLETLDRFRAAAPSCPIVVFTGTDDLDVALSALRRGADDYLPKSEGSPDALRRVLTHALERRALANENKRLLNDARRAIEARDDLVRVVSHDLRNQLATVVSGLQLLQMDAHDETRRRRRHAQMESAVGMMRRLLGDLLDLAALEKGTLSVVPAEHDSALIVEEAQKAFIAAAETRQIRLLTRAESIGVLVDRERMVQVLGNLISNAIRYTPQGGTITVSCEGMDGAVAFRVHDTGPGIPAMDRERLFDKFFRGSSARGEGLGLGLTIAKGLVDAQRGRIWVEGAPDGGAEFVFTVPRATLVRSVAAGA